MLKQLTLAVLASVVVAGCSTMKVVEVDSTSGYFPGASKKAVVVKNVKTDLDARKSLILVPNGDFTGEMVRKIGYFDEVINFEDLEKIIVQHNLSDTVPSVSERIGINKAAKAYKAFLWIHWDTRKDGSKEYQQLVLTDAVTLDDYFVAETYLDYIWTGVNDQNNNYPAMHALIDYIRENSKTF